MLTNWKAFRPREPAALPAGVREVSREDLKSIVAGRGRDEKQAAAGGDLSLASQALAGATQADVAKPAATAAPPDVKPAEAKAPAAATPAGDAGKDTGKDSGKDSGKKALVDKAIENLKQTPGEWKIKTSVPLGNEARKGEGEKDAKKVLQPLHEKVIKPSGEFIKHVGGGILKFAQTQAVKAQTDIKQGFSNAVTKVTDAGKTVAKFAGDTGKKIADGASNAWSWFKGLFRR